MTWDKIVKWIAAAAGAVAGVFGGWDLTLKVLVACIIIDYASGWIVAILGHSVKTEDGHLDSRISYKGILKKCLILAMVLMATLLDQAIGADNAVFRSMVIWFYISNEALSILENMALAGVPFPRGIKNVLEQIRERNDKPPDTPDQDPDDDHVKIDE